MQRYRFTVHPETPITSLRKTRLRSLCSSSWGSWSAGSPTTWSPSSLKKEIWDVEILDFKTLRKKCGTNMLPINPVTIRTTSVERVPGGTGAHFTGSNGSNTSCTLGETVSDIPFWVETGWLVTVPEFDSSLIDAVKLAAIAQLRAASYDALTDLMELRKSIDLFRDLSTKMDGFLNACIELTRKYVRQRAAKKAMKLSVSEVYRIFTEVTSEQWLKYRYGIMPIVYSLEAALLSQKRQKGGLIRDRAVRTESLNLSETLQWDPTTSETRSTTQTVTGSRIYRATAYGRVDVQGLGSFDPIVSGYEILKWSFILDWLIDVGSYLQAISPFAHVTTKAVCVSVKTIVERRQSLSIEWHNVSPSNRHWGTFGPSQTIETVEEYVRWASDTSVPWPHWNLRLNFPRIGDLVAIALQLKKGLQNKLLRI
jgi:hypothetical protein